MGREHDEDMTAEDFEAEFRSGTPVTPTGHPKVVVETGAHAGLVLGCHEVDVADGCFWDLGLPAA